MSDFAAFRHRKAVQRCAAEIERAVGFQVPPDLNLAALDIDSLGALQQTVQAVRGAVQAAEKYLRLVDAPPPRVPGTATHAQRAIILATGRPVPRKLDLEPLGDAGQDALATLIYGLRQRVLDAKEKLRRETD